ncbi:hypothetical protein FHS86_000929 [Roseimarinus sediminis]
MFIIFKTYLTIMHINFKRNAFYFFTEIYEHPFIENFDI